MAKKLTYWVELPGGLREADSEEIESALLHLRVIRRLRREITNRQAKLQRLLKECSHSVVYDDLGWDDSIVIAPKQSRLLRKCASCGRLLAVNPNP